MIDSELDEIVWITELIELLKGLEEMAAKDKEGTRRKIRAQLRRLEHVLVEEKVLARIILKHSLELLDPGRRSD